MWEYNAPQYVDFSKRFDDDRADAYFGMFISVHRICTFTWRKAGSINTSPTC